jgi:hypothetical protein
MSTVYVRTRVVVVAAMDSDEKDVQLKREDQTQTTVNHQFAAEESGHIVLGASETNFNLPMGKVATGALLFIESDQELNLRFDGGAEDIPIKPTGAGVKAKLLLTSDFTTAPQVDNTAAVVANVTFLIAGATA